MHEDQFFLVWTMVLQSTLMGILIVVLCDFTTHRLRLEPPLALAAALLLFGVLGYLAFWTAYWNYTSLRVAKIAVLALVLWRLMLIAREHRLKTLLAWLGEPMIYVFLFFVAVEGLGFGNGGIDDPARTAQNRFSHALPPDNVIPFLFAAGLKLPQMPSPLLADWLSSDRPPLQTGLYLLLYVRDRALPYQVLASLLQATFLFGVWILCAATGVSAVTRRITLLACCLLPVSIINTFYVWPKLVSVGYLLIVFTLLFVCRPRDAREQTIVGILLGGTAALAALFHGTSAFALIGMAMVVLVTWQWPNWRTSGYAVAALVMLYLPWIGYQQFADPPGNRLLKYHLAGVMKPDGRGFVETMRDAYGALTWDGYIAGRLANLATFVGRPFEHLRNLGAVTLSQDSNYAKYLRAPDFFNFLPSLHVALLALIIAMLLLPFMRGAQRQIRRTVLNLLAVVAATLLVCVVILFQPGATTNHQTSYALPVMTTVAAFITIGSLSSRLALTLLFAQFVTVATLYGLLVSYDRTSLPAILLCISATGALIVYTLAPFAQAKKRQTVPPYS